MAAPGATWRARGRQGPRRASPRGARRRRFAEEAALRELEALRGPLLCELERLRRQPDYWRNLPPHACCTRQLNQMRISPIEAQAIARAFESDPELRRKLPQVLRRLREELRRLADSSERQSFDCPLLEEGRCLVHRTAKPIGCLAWHPPGPETPAGEFPFTAKGWEAFARRDRINDKLYGPDWKLRVIPLWLKRVLGSDRGAAKPRRS
jgi:hypothetical protein